MSQNDKLINQVAIALLEYREPDIARRRYRIFFWISIPVLFFILPLSAQYGGRGVVVWAFSAMAGVIFGVSRWPQPGVIAITERSIIKCDYRVRRTLWEVDRGEVISARTYGKKLLIRIPKKSYIVYTASVDDASRILAAISID